MKNQIRSLSKGMSLIELMVVVAIVGILAAIAIPKYRAHVINQNEKSMSILVSGIISQLHSWRRDNGAYNARIRSGGQQFFGDGLANMIDNDHKYNLKVNDRSPLYVQLAYPRTGQVLYTIDICVDQGGGGICSSNVENNNFFIQVTPRDNQTRATCGQNNISMNRNGVIDKEKKLVRNCKDLFVPLM